MQITKTKDSQGKEYQVVDETFFNTATPEAVISLLNHSRQYQTRFRIHYGEPKSGKAWGDIETGHISRSSGTIKIPLLIHNARSLGGYAVLDHCIVKIEHANKKNGGIIYDITK